MKKSQKKMESLDERYRKREGRTLQGKENRPGTSEGKSGRGVRTKMEGGCYVVKEEKKKET